MPDTPRRADPVDGGVLFSGAAAQRIADAVKWVEANARNRAQLQPRGNRPSNTEVFIARCTVTLSGGLPVLDALGFYPCVISRYDPQAAAWTDFATAHLQPLNGETLVGGTRYGVRPIGPASDGVPVFQVLAASGGGGTGAGSLLTVDVDYTTLAAAGAVTSATFNLAAPLPSNYCTVVMGYRINAGDEFKGGAITATNASFHFGTSGPYGSWNWTLTGPVANQQSLFVAGNVFGSTADNWTLTFTSNIGAFDTMNHLTQGHATLWLFYFQVP